MPLIIEKKNTRDLVDQSTNRFDKHTNIRHHHQHHDLMCGFKRSGYILVSFANIKALMQCIRNLKIKIFVLFWLSALLYLNKKKENIQRKKIRMMSARVVSIVWGLWFFSLNV